MIIILKIIFKCLNKLKRKSIKNKHNFTFQKIYRLNLTFKKIECRRLNCQNQIFKIIALVPVLIQFKQKANKAKLTQKTKYKK